MRELRTCGLCGTNTIDMFEVLPPTLTPADGQRYVVLCKHCEEILGGVITPLLSRLGVDADVDMADDARAETGAPTTPERATNGSGDKATSVNVNTVDPAPTSPEPVDHDPSDEGGDTGSPGDDANDSDGVDDKAEVEIEVEARTGTENESSASATDEQSQPDGESGRGKKLSKLRKVIRIPQSREFPVGRVEVEALTPGAYNFDGGEVIGIFDYTIERRLLVDNSGIL